MVWPDLITVMATEETTPQLSAHLSSNVAQSWLVHRNTAHGIFVNWAFQAKTSEKNKNSWVHEVYYRMEVHFCQLKEKKSNEIKPWFEKYSHSQVMIMRLWLFWRLFVQFWLFSHNFDFFPPQFYPFPIIQTFLLTILTYFHTIFHNFPLEYPFDFFSHNLGFFFSQFWLFPHNVAIFLTFFFFCCWQFWLIFTQFFTTYHGNIPFPIIQTFFFSQFWLFFTMSHDLPWEYEKKNVTM